MHKGLKERMGTTADGVTADGMLAGKQDYTSDMGLPIDSSLAPWGDIGDVMDALADGADVEILISWGDGTGHAAMITSIVALSDGSFQITYVDDPVATLRRLVRVVRPGGTVAMLEFGLPRGFWRPLWELYVRVGLPAAGRLISPGWHEVGRFLGPSIRGFHARHPSLPALFAEAGVAEVRERRLSIGGGVVVWGRAP